MEGERVVVRVDLEYKAFSGCRRRPAVVLLDAAMRVPPGGVLEVRGSREVLSLESVVETLEDLGFDVEEVSVEEGGRVYLVRAVMPG